MEEKTEGSPAQLFPFNPNRYPALNKRASVPSRFTLLRVTGSLSLFPARAVCACDATNIASYGSSRFMYRRRAPTGPAMVCVVNVSVHVGKRPEAWVSMVAVH